MLVGNDVTFAPIAGAWTSYTPTFTNLTIGNGQRAAAYMQVGKTVIYAGRLDWGSTTSATATDTLVSLPVAPTQTMADRSRGSVYLVDSGTRAYIGVCYMPNTTTMGFSHTESGNFGGVNSLNPFTWTANDSISWTITYEAA